jgi:hypothetical protein
MKAMETAQAGLLKAINHIQPETTPVGIFRPALPDMIEMGMDA